MSQILLPGRSRLQPVNPRGINPRYANKLMTVWVPSFGPKGLGGAVNDLTVSEHVSTVAGINGKEWRFTGTDYNTGITAGAGNAWFILLGSAANNTTGANMELLGTTGDGLRVTSGQQVLLRVAATTQISGAVISAGQSIFAGFNNMAYTLSQRNRGSASNTWQTSGANYGAATPSVLMNAKNLSIAMLVRFKYMPSRSFVEALHRNPWMLFERSSRPLFFTTAASALVEAVSVAQNSTIDGAQCKQTHLTTCASASQDSACGDGTVQQYHKVLTAAVSQLSAAETVSISQQHALSAAPLHGDNQSSAASVQQTAMVGAVPATNLNVASSGTVSTHHKVSATDVDAGGSVAHGLVYAQHNITAANVSVNSVSTSGGVSAPNTQSVNPVSVSCGSVSADGAITQTHKIEPVGSVVATHSAASAAVAQQHRVAGDSVVATQDTTYGSVHSGAPATLITASDVTCDSVVSGAAIRVSHLLSSAHADVDNHTTAGLVGQLHVVYVDDVIGAILAPPISVRSGAPVTGDTPYERVEVVPQSVRIFAAPKDSRTFVVP